MTLRLPGGGAALTNSSVMIVQCVFDTNTADFWGGFRPGNRIAPGRRLLRVEDLALTAARFGACVKR